MDTQTLAPQNATQKRVEDHARQMIQKLDIPKNTDFNRFCGKYYDEVFEEIKNYASSLLGKIAAAGLQDEGLDQAETSLYAIHRGRWTNKKASGKVLLQSIAATAIVAKMWDLLKEE